MYKSDKSTKNKTDYYNYDDDDVVDDGDDDVTLIREDCKQTNPDLFEMVKNKQQKCDNNDKPAVPSSSKSKVSRLKPQETTTTKSELTTPINTFSSMSTTTIDSLTTTKTKPPATSQSTTSQHLNNTTATLAIIVALISCTSSMYLWFKLCNLEHGWHAEKMKIIDDVRSLLAGVYGGKNNAVNVLQVLLFLFQLLTFC
ncbi:hypothetical protein HELRODRAFT_170402 [Helobdella robusta]|uniref:Uncharacterized protein n=1 Tax=Helobdella robusta TaxID=6412 RepID=T1F305_HELRO|nr:hypothetical protein HELRODRAFT_170402 [Helobdella robusta]ESO07103.1 hypothetical protein HELRODRAFT_170402 [Helobdella robusta]